MQAIYLDGQGVTGQGSKQVCPCQQTTYTLRVVKRDGSPENRQVTIMVYGACPAPPAPPTTVRPPTATTAPPQDKTAPGINNVGLRWADCKFYGRATVSDPAGVAWAQFYFNLKGGGWRGVWMRHTGGGNYEAEAGIDIMSGIGTPIGSLEYYVKAGDNLGNQGESSHRSCNYTSCSGCQ